MTQSPFPNQELIPSGKRKTSFFQWSISTTLHGRSHAQEQLANAKSTLWGAFSGVGMGLLFHFVLVFFLLLFVFFIFVFVGFESEQREDEVGWVERWVES